MDLVSLETQEENDYFQNWLAARNTSYCSHVIASCQRQGIKSFWGFSQGTDNHIAFLIVEKVWLSVF